MPWLAGPSLPQVQARLGQPLLRFILVAFFESKSLFDLTETRKKAKLDSLPVRIVWFCST
jgi:hypothetical protein